MNEFYKDLQYSLTHKPEDIDQFYHTNFFDLVSVETVDDMDMQLAGIDKVLIFGSGKRVYIDEKVRRTDYPDILLEEWSNRERKTKGWLSRKKHTDYIIYIKPSKVFILPFLLLRECWVDSYHGWKEKYGVIEAKNYTEGGQYLYTTTNVPIPDSVLLESLKQRMGSS